MSTIISLVLWFLAIGCGLMAGVYFAFSAFIMTALTRSGTATAIRAMNAINVVILKSAFMPLFYATSPGSLLVALAALLNWDGRAAPIIVAGAVIYFVGMTVVTIACNVPLNNELAATDPIVSPECSRLVKVLRAMDNVEPRSHRCLNACLHRIRRFPLHALRS